MKNYWKNGVVTILIILLLPYTVTSFLKGGVQFGKRDKKESGKTIIVNDNNVNVTLDIEQYIIGVAAAQIPVYYEDEAIKAQLVIARTSVMDKIDGRESMETSDLGIPYMNLTQMEKAWGDEHFFTYYTKLQTLAEQTKGVIMTYEGKPVQAAFHAVSTGKTRSGEIALKSSRYPYLQSVDCEQDKNSEEYLTIISVTEKDIETALDLTKPALPIKVETDEAGYARQVVAGGQTINGEAFRKALRLPSACFSIEQVSDRIRITCKGKGHGVGLSQYSANEMAKQGKNYREILTYFYQNIEMTNE